MKAMKFRVKDEQHSKEIQEALFAAGYSWYGDKKVVEHTADPYLYAEAKGYILYSDSHSPDFFEQDSNEETILYNGNFIPADMQPVTEQPAEKPLVRPRKQLLQERQVELLRGLLAQAEAAATVVDEYLKEIAENNEILKNQVDTRKE